MRVLLVDDEELARSRLRSLLQGYDDIEIVGEAQDGEEAIERIDELKPDLVFLDIQMPGCSGTDVVESLRSPRPRIIFCTAFDQYALDAFELAALDYLLKPVTRARLAKAIERARQSSLEANESSLAQAAASGVPRAGRFLAKRAGRYRVVSQSEVLYFAFEEGLTKMHAVDQEYCMDPTLNELEERLDPSVFFRISRAAIVNLDHVQEVLPLPGGYGWVTLKGKIRLEVSRRRLKDLMNRLGEC